MYTGIGFLKFIQQLSRSKERFNKLDLILEIWLVINSSLFYLWNTEINYFDDFLRIDQQIARFDIIMYNALTVQVVEAI